MLVCGDANVTLGYVSINRVTVSGFGLAYMYRAYTRIPAYHYLPRKAPSRPVTISKQRCRIRMLQAERFFRQSRMLLRHCCILATMSNKFFVKFRPFDKVETNWICSVCSTLFDNNAKTTFDFVGKIVRLLAFDNVFSKFLLVWTGLNTSSYTGNGINFDICF